MERLYNSRKRLQCIQSCWRNTTDLVLSVLRKWMPSLALLRADTVVGWMFFRTHTHMHIIGREALKLPV